MATLRTQWQRIQNYIWLVCGLVCLFAALVFWAMTDSDALVEVEKSAETASELQIQPEKVAATSLLGALQEEVRPLEMTTRVVTTGSYEPEFRGSKFINDNKPGLNLRRKTIAPSGEEVEFVIGFGVEFFRVFYGV